MARAKSVWGVDIGQCALKALKLGDVDGKFQIEAFDVIEHPENLRGPDVDRSEVFIHALGQFLAKNDVSNSEIAVSVPGQSSFMRFVKLPPVEPKRIPSIVRFEAEQQIPFPIDEVVWRWQTFHDPDSPDVEVGIFAMKRMEIAEMLATMSFAELKVDLVQMAPLALYNFMCVDGQLASDGATLLADVGADKTDLVVADGPRIWTRTIQIGGNNFTEALVRAFKLSFGKAESLKRTAATSKYARQVFQAMRPVFADLVQEIQRSIGYYTSLHRESRFKRVLGMGNGFRLPGLQKFLEQNLSIPVVKIDNFNGTTLEPSLSEPKFAESVLSFGVAYGLAIQGLNQAEVGTNLLPDEVVRKRLWDSKRPWFGAAVAALLIAMSCWVYRGFADRIPFADDSGTPTGRAKVIINGLEGLQDEARKIGKGAEEVAQMRALMASYGYRKFWPSCPPPVGHHTRIECDLRRALPEAVEVRVTHLPYSKFDVGIVTLVHEYRQPEARFVHEGRAVGDVIAGWNENPPVGANLAGVRDDANVAVPSLRPHPDLLECPVDLLGHALAPLGLVPASQAVPERSWRRRQHVPVTHNVRRSFPFLVWSRIL